MHASLLSLGLAAFVTAGDDESAPPPTLELMLVRAGIPADAELAAGKSATLNISAEVAKDWSSSDSGIPQPIVQIRVPEGVFLAGTYLEERKELSRNEFLRAPFEQMLEGELTVKFELRGPPAADAAIEFNVLAYLGKGDDHRFFRNRYRVPLRPGGQATPVDAGDSSWGNADILQLGDTAENFELGNAAGDEVVLDDLLAEGYVIVTTYRAFW